MEHFKAHFNPRDPSVDYTPKELLSSEIPSFVDDLREISKNNQINDEAPSIQEIQQHLRKLKANKASNDIEPELLQRCDHPVMLQVIHRMTDNLWNNMDLPESWGNSRLKTLWKGKGSKRIQINTVD